MVCFTITIAYPLNSRYSVNDAYEVRIEHLRKHYRADCLSQSYEGHEKHITFAMCDEDAVAFLRDVPQPTTCISVGILRTDILLYSNCKRTGIFVQPPHNHLLKKVYWRAAQLQKWDPIRLSKTLAYAS